MQTSIQSISRNELKNRIDKGNIRVVEALGVDQFEKFHLPKAINVPWGDSFATQIQKAIPDKRQPVAVYCLNEECDASPRAAEKMAELGYENVFDYEEGKMGWKQAGLPIEN